MNAVVWLNHHCLGRHPFGYTGFHFDLSSYIDWNGTNSLKVFVDNAHQLNSRWYSGSGIYRPMWVIVADLIHVAHWGVYITTPEISVDNALVKIRTLIENEVDVEKNVRLRTQIMALNGSEAGVLTEEAYILGGSSHEFDAEIPIASSQLWSPDTSG